MNHKEYNIFRAIAVGNIGFVKDFLSNGGDPNFEDNGWTLLTCAIENERIEIVEILLNNGTDVNYRSSNGWTALHQAVDISIDGTIQTGGKPGEEPIDIIKFLLDKGANINIEDIQGNSSLDIAMRYNSKKIINFLKEYRTNK
ncbi:ankyrin repeat domain-containing protein [Paenibacillus apis]|uniref:Ankyrin repeat domain-containing protein n=1 Tax=Paenibacillus apis TaxID=1792174 RepID=A0A919Y362_9BACL|nr:ankyrin repeat domain-containing protein [Paenibacillus apis]GIO41565.1 hypothetical protein J41TS4_13230 [Paenibacillus apis]